MSSKTQKHFTFIAVSAFLMTVLCAQASHANIHVIKKYKEAFGSASPKCITCHMVKLPKKGEGQHEMNPYGQKLKDAGGQDITIEDLKKIGPKPEAE